ARSSVQSSEYDMDTTPYRFGQVLHSEFAAEHFSMKRYEPDKKELIFIIIFNALCQKKTKPRLRKSINNAL
ncbi:hypothetical protein, partial [Vreelandella gomseomensis]